MRVLPPTSGAPGPSQSIVDGPFDMVVEVTGGVPHDLTLTPQLPSWAASLPSADPLTIPAGSCPDLCTVSWRIDPASEATPWYPGVFSLGVSAQMEDRSVQTYANGANYAPVVQRTWLTGVEPTATPNTLGTAQGVFDTGGSVSFGGYAGRGADEQVRVKVLPAEGDLSATPLLSVSASWSSDPDPRTGYAAGHVKLDTSAVPEGRYRLVAQAHDAASRWSYATPGSIVVVHSPRVAAHPSGPGIVAAGRPIDVRAVVQGLGSPGTRLGTVRVTANGTVTDFPTGPGDWYEPNDTTQPSTRWVTLSTAGMPLGRLPVDVQVFDVGGKIRGTASTSINVVDFHESVTVSTLVVGRTASVRLRATAPAGTALLQCFVYLRDPLTQDRMYNLCAGPRVTSVDAPEVFVPQTAGSGLLTADIMAHDDVVGPHRDIPVTVYANRTTALSAPAQSTWGTVQTASVTILDEKKLGVRSPVSGLNVTLQRKTAGTSTWMNVASAVTGSTGKAAIRYTSTANAKLRAVVKGTVPGTTASSAERPTTSVAVVAWSSLPTTARYGSIVTAAGYAKPYQKGATIRLQARKFGTSTWTSYGSGSVAANGYAKATARLSSRGTWQVRIQRVGTTTHASGYSTVRSIKVV